MGRHAGWVTAASSLARKFPGDNPLLIYMPEAPFEMEAGNFPWKKPAVTVPLVSVKVMKTRRLYVQL